MLLLFWTYQTPASNRLVNTFLDTGRVDTSLYTRTPVDFTPALGHGPIAEIVLGCMLALAGLMVLSLVLMALRVRWRGPFGRRSRVVLRAVYPVVVPFTHRESEPLIRIALKQLVAPGHLKTGDQIVIISSIAIGESHADAIQMRTIE